ncbi:MAG: hypothetical protein WKG07_11485 [Hymenobacter sp.]
MALTTEQGRRCLYAALNGNNQLVKLDLATGQTLWTQPTGTAPTAWPWPASKVFVSNWGGPLPTDTLGREAAGVPRAYGRAYVDPTHRGHRPGHGVGHAPHRWPLGERAARGAAPHGPAGQPRRAVCVRGQRQQRRGERGGRGRPARRAETIAVQLLPGPLGYGGDSPNALALDAAGTTLYVANGLDNAVAVVQLGQAAARAGAPGASQVRGFIPTEAYPGGLALGPARCLWPTWKGRAARVSTQDIRAEGGELEPQLNCRAGGLQRAPPAGHGVADSAAHGPAAGAVHRPGAAAEFCLPQGTGPAAAPAQRATGAAA